ncbi:ABC transporter ATP-binding protein [Lampropedia puyangensis]|uniref:ABC transporter ATP-binding protein n=1 Tax=Lampropedia puyangensis TaxID=1330072 RepID=A0A4S8F5X0_9BURK|nr:ABC transporter ATP-binding protein [Lampropedia puyangensis]THU02828.1 ABC transporter ATP-binding protein [Lampropedia puyangensis]
MSSEIAISVESVSKRYEMYSKPRDRLLQFFSSGNKQYFKEFWALQKISFDVKKGETLGILGRNGSGKSTLLQIIAGTLTPTTGSVRTSGVMAALLELGSGFNPEFTGRENIYLNGVILGFSRHEMDKRFDEIVSFADIGDHLDQPIKTYSSGMTVRLAFSVQACVSPQVLIVDEALSVGDEKFQRKCFEYIEKLRKDGCSILLVTHSTATVEKFCQRGVLLHKGEMRGIGPAKEIVDQYHALLYSDEKAYLRYQASRDANQHSSAMQNQHAKEDTPSSGLSTEDTSGLRAVISGWDIFDTQGNPCEQYQTGDTFRVKLLIDVLSSVEEIQAGMLMRTVEGVSAFGTSTLYHKKNITAPQKGSRYEVEFEVEVSLCAGSYFITLAIAEAISHSDMRYLDRKTDVIVVTVHQPRTLASGIAMLDAKITVSEVL